jgi:subtilisin family serine protease
MTRRLLACTIVLLAACAGEQSPTSNDQAGAPAAVGAKRYIVVYNDNVSGPQTATSEILRSIGAEADYVYSASIKGFAAVMSEDAVANLRNDPRVKYIQEDGVVSIHITQSPTPSWGLDRIDQRNRPLTNSYTYNGTGAGVHFYGLDTGIRGSHTDFTGRMGGGANFINDGNGTNDCNGHGTHTASTAAGTTYGVAKGMTVHPVRVLDCFGSGTFAGVVMGIDWVTANHVSPAVANMSLGGGFDQATNDAVTASIAAGVTYTLSSGNSSANACSFSPASTPNGITVNASTITDARASFSNFGNCTDIFAPGVGITAAWSTSNTATNTIDGTSMSAPHVAGAAGLYLQANPNATPAQVASALTSNATMNLVTNPGTGSPNRLLFMGFIGGGPPPGNISPVARFTWSCTVRRKCTFNGTTSSDPDGNIVSYRWVRTSGSEVVLMSTNPTFTKNYKQSPTYLLTLTVTDNAGATNSVTQTITVP